MSINTERWSEKYRSASIDLIHKRLLITNLKGSGQEQDLTEPPNCDGYGRIRHFRRTTSKGWPSNPLPIDPASKALGIEQGTSLRAQAFQNAACNWRCWYCFVPFDLLAANRKHSEWINAKQLIDLYLSQQDPPRVIDLTGGEPGLVPEWSLWIMEELTKRGLHNKVYLWSDDNLSTDYFWRYLSEAEQQVIASFRNYSRVGCFKGFDDSSFAFNTAADPSLFDRQFELMAKLVTTGMDIYGYATFTSPTPQRIAEHMRIFVDRLQKIDENLPLRIVPLEVQVFTPVQARLNSANTDSLKNQWVAIEAWQRELSDRYSSSLRSLPINEVPLRRQYA